MKTFHCQKITVLLLTMPLVAKTLELVNNYLLYIEYSADNFQCLLKLSHSIM